MPRNYVLRIRGPSDGLHSLDAEAGAFALVGADAGMGVEEAPTEPSALHPNEPAGMTVVCNADGSVAEEGGDTFGEPKFGGFAGNGSLSVVSDPGNPTGSGSAVRVHWTDDGAGSADIFFDDVEGAPWTTLYVAYRVVKYTALWPEFAHKWFYLFSPGQGAPGGGVWTAIEPNDDWRVIDGNDDVEIDVDGILDIRDAEMLMEFVFVAESSEDAGDGEVHVYLNGEHLQSSTTLNSGGGPAWDGIHWYNNANAEQEGSHDVREFYVSVK